MIKLRKISIKEAIKNEPYLKCDYRKGLTSDQVRDYDQKGLINKTKKHFNKSYVKIIITNLFSYFNFLLVAIAIFMAFAQLYSGMFFVVILFANIAIGLIQDIRARRLTDKLRIVTEPKARVIRDGSETLISTSELVYNDVILVKAGNQIPSDAIVINGAVKINESMLTGESADVLRGPGSQTYAGSYVTSGTAYLQINRIGILNYAEQLRNRASDFKRPKSEILRSTNILFRVICIIVTILGIAMIVTSSLQNGFIDSASQSGSIKYISGSMVSMIPSGMYLLTSLTLAVGVITLAYRRMLVQDLYCIETLARVDVLCLDKTGTLTDGTMSVKEVIYVNEEKKEIVGSYIRSLLEATQDENSTAIAMRNYFQSSNLLNSIAAVPFSSDNKYSAATLKNGKTIIIGAPEFVTKSIPMDVQIINDSYIKKGYRTLVVNTSDLPIHDDVIPDDSSIAALIVIKDNICKDARENINWFRNNGVKIKIISGDNPITVSEIAKEVGVEGADKFISLEGKSNDEIKRLVFAYDVFGRVTPEQKELIVEVLREEGHVVAMTGDGVNDILALKRADCSIAMARGSDAAKDVSYLVSLDSNFSSLPKVVQEGRRVINNLQRTCSLFLVKTVFAITLTAIFLIGSWVDSTIVYPFSTNNMYVWEILTIGIAAFFLALQRNDERLQGSFLFNIILKALPAAFIEIAIVATFFIACRVNSSVFTPESAKTLSVIGFTFLSYVILLRISWPFDEYRIILFASLSLLGITLFVVDGLLLNGKMFEIDYSSLNGAPLLLLILSLLIATPLYFVIDYLLRHLVFIVKRRKLL
ncbi:MAG: HAD-IC family P-type ATPase [Bacilli bacterium]|jgi:cation-transporting ATPase E